MGFDLMDFSKRQWTSQFRDFSVFSEGIFYIMLANLKANVPSDVIWFLHMAGKIKSRSSTIAI